MGIAYRLNEYRQQIVFYKDLYRHYLKYGIHFDRTGQDRTGQDRTGQDRTGQDTIPKIIHYCWFGRGKQNELIKRCISSWKQYLPEYEIILWNEDNFPVNKYPFAQQALNDRKWAFVSDVARLYALYYYGGIYMDTDVEVLKPLDKFLSHGFFSGYESLRHIPTGIMGAKKHNEYVKLLLSWYKDKCYGKDYYEIANTRIITRITRLNCGLKVNGKQFNFGDCCYYPREYFCPKRTENGWKISANTYTIHHFTGLW